MVVIQIETLKKKKRKRKKTVESSDIRLTFLSRSTEKQAGHYGKTAVID